MIVEQTSPEAATHRLISKAAFHIVREENVLLADFLEQSSALVVGIMPGAILVVVPMQASFWFLNKIAHLGSRAIRTETFIAIFP